MKTSTPKLFLLTLTAFVITFVSLSLHKKPASTLTKNTNTENPCPNWDAISKNDISIAAVAAGPEKMNWKNGNLMPVNYCTKPGGDDYPPLLQKAAKK